MFNLKNIFPILSYIILFILINFINGDVQICLKLDSQYDLQNSAGAEEISSLLQKVTNELKSSIKKAKYNSAQSSNYTYFHFNFSHPAVTLEGNFTNGSVSIENQTDLRLFTLVSDGFEIFNLTLPSISVNGSYNMNGYVGRDRLFDLYGKGDFSLELINVSLAAVTSLTINSSSLCIPLTMKVNVIDFKNNFTNLMNGDEDLDSLINGAIQAIVPEAISIIFREGADAIDPLIQNIIDKILKLDTLNSLVRLLYLLSRNSNQLSTMFGPEESYEEVYNL